MVSVSATPSSAQYRYLPQNLLTLPTTGQMYGSKSTLNLETLLSCNAQLVIDLGDRKENMEQDLDALQKQIGIPVIGRCPHGENVPHARFDLIRQGGARQ